MDKIKKQKNMGKIFVLVLVLLIGLPVFVSADMFDTLELFESKNCKLINEDSISSPFLADLESKFGLPGGDNCTIVLDHLPYGELAEELIYFPTDYIELDHIIEDDEEYLFLLATSDSNLDPIIEITANYDDHEPFLNNFGFWVPIWENTLLNVSDPVPNDCVSQNGNPFIGNSISYLVDGNTQTSDSTCFEGSLIYPYCDSQVSFWDTFECTCDSGMCIASFNDVFNLVSAWEPFVVTFPPQPPRDLADFELIDSALNSWLSS